MRPRRPSGLYFQRLRLENWKNFTQAEIALQPRTFLAGPSACGKSNLFDAFRFLHDLARAGGGFADAVAARQGVGKLRSLAARQSSGIGIAVQLGTGEEPGLWEYELHFSEGEARRPEITRERVAHRGEDLVQRPDPDDERDPERLTQTFLEQSTVNREFREVAALFRSIRYVHPVPQLMRGPARGIPRHNDPHGSDFLERIVQTPQNTRASRLRRIAGVLRAAVPQLQELELYWDEARGTPHLRGKYRHWRPQGAWHNEDQFADGTLRLFALLWAAAEESGPLLLEEPELSLHPDLVSQIPRMLAAMRLRGGRQIFISTHAEAILRDEDIGPGEVLLLIPETEGTVVRPADAVRQVASLLCGGLGQPETPAGAGSPGVEQLSLFRAAREACSTEPPVA